MLQINNNETKRCPQCGQIHDDDVLTCDCGHTFSPRPSPFPAVLRMPMILMLFGAMALATWGTIAVGSIGILLIAGGVLSLLVGKDKVWEYERWRLKEFRGIEAEQTAGWVALFILSVIILIIGGAVWLFIDLLALF